MSDAVTSGSVANPANATESSFGAERLKSGNGVGGMKSTRNTLLDTVVHTLYQADWKTQGYDIRCLGAIQDCLMILGGSAMFIRATERPIEVVTLRKAEQRAEEHRLKIGATRRVIETACARCCAEGREFVKVPDTGCDYVAIARIQNSYRSHAESPSGGVSIDNYAALMFDSREVARRLRLPVEPSQGTRIEQLVAHALRSSLLVLYDAFMHRERRFASFAPVISERYWSDSVGAIDGTIDLHDKAMLLSPPWDTPDMRASTASLCCDLRKSTHCMEQAAAPNLFGEWLNELTEVLRAVCHVHCGVFDKFTGDGALVHFLDRECRAIDGMSAVESAVNCAVDMQRAIEIHLERLRKVLRLDSPVFGAGIGIDIDDAYWSHDHRDNPIVVGRGVVGACRLCDGAPRGRVRLTNVAYQRFIAAESANIDLLPVVEQVPIVTKEVADSLKMQCWEFVVPYPRPDIGLGKGLPRVRTLCDGIYERLRSNGLEKIIGGKRVEV